VLVLVLLLLQALPLRTTPGVTLPYSPDAMLWASSAEPKSISRTCSWVGSGCLLLLWLVLLVVGSSAAAAAAAVGVTSRFSGLTSRWLMPAACSTASACSSWCSTEATSAWPVAASRRAASHHWLGPSRDRQGVGSLALALLLLLLLLVSACPASPPPSCTASYIRLCRERPSFWWQQCNR
jgi:hypothetical protein